MNIKYKPVSQEAVKGLNKTHKRIIISKFPIDKPNCSCQKDIYTYSKHIGSLNEKKRQGFIDEIMPYQCPEAEKKQLYSLICPNCKEVVALVHADNNKLDNWCNFHYVSWYDKDSWYGTYGVNIDPYTKEMRIECCCKENRLVKNFTIKKGE